MRKAELETNFITNLKWQKQKLEAIISFAKSEILHGEAELKGQELNEANSLAEVVTQELWRELWVVLRNLIIIFHCKRLFRLAVLPGVSDRMDRLIGLSHNTRTLNYEFALLLFYVIND